jgi:hypothetical protein
VNVQRDLMVGRAGENCCADSAKFKCQADIANACLVYTFPCLAEVVVDCNLRSSTSGLPIRVDRPWASSTFFNVFVVPLLCCNEEVVLSGYPAWVF